MADKQASEIKTFFSLIKTHKTTQLAYGCMLGLLIFTFFLAFSPNTTTNLYSVSSFNTSSVFSKQSFTSFFSHFFPNSKQFFTQNLSPDVSFSNINKTQIGNCSQNTIEVQNSLVKQNQSIIEIPKSPIASNSTEYVNPKSLEKHNKSITEVPNSLTKQNQTTIEKKQSIIEIPKSPKNLNSTEFLTTKPLSSAEHSKENNNVTENGVGLLSNITSGLAKKQSKNESNLVGKLNGNNKSEDIVNSLKSCDLFDGEWVKDDSYPLYKPGSCSLIDEQFNCFRNGRPDNGYYKLKWKPKGCSIPRLNGTHMLEMLRGKRLVFVGDSLNRNMWESLVCILKNSVKDQRKVYEASGRRHFRTEPFYSFVFKDYDCTIEFFVSPFLVQEWEMAEKSGSKKETLRLDIVRRSAAQYKSADILVFNTGHWWTHEKTAKGTDYYQEGKHIFHNLNVLEAFHKALTTWGKWVDANVDPKKALVFFRGYSASHFKGGQWNSGGQCDHETEPIKNTTYLSKYPPKMTVLEQVLNSMKTRVSYLNITRLTDYRKDGHPSLYRKQTYSREELKSPLSFQDCSHWCLPGVPDSWNELLYADLLIKESENKKQ